MKAKKVKKGRTYIAQNPKRETIFLVNGDMNNQIKGASVKEVLQKHYGR